MLKKEYKYTLKYVCTVCKCKGETSSDTEIEPITMCTMCQNMHDYNECNKGQALHNFDPPVEKPSHPMEFPRLAGAMRMPEHPPPEPICLTCGLTEMEACTRQLDPKPYGPCEPQDDDAVKARIRHRRVDIIRRSLPEIGAPCSNVPLRLAIKRQRELIAAYDAEVKLGVELDKLIKELAND